MALGLLLWVSWICSLLFNGSFGLPAIKGYGYPYVADWRNIGDDVEDQVLNSPRFDQTNWQASNNHWTGYSKPSVAQQRYLVPTSQNLPNIPSAREVERLVNGEPRDWGLENLDKPLVFPLRPNSQLSDPAKPQPSPIQPQSSVSVASTNSVPIFPNTGGSTQYASPTAYYEPTLSYTSQASPSFESWKPELVSSYGVDDYGFGNQNQDFYTGSSGGDSSNVPHLVFEEVFQYPSKNTDGLSDPSYSDVSSTRAHVLSKVSQRVSEPILPPPPQSYIIQSRNGYRRGRYIFSESKYSPEFPFPMGVSSKGVKSPAPSQPAASKGVKSPERTKW